jgi:cytosine/adenosine deaminase-related metal-dependent hydrolase
MPLLISGSLISPIDKRSYEALPNAFVYVGDDGLIKAIHQITPLDGTPITEESFLRKLGHGGDLERLHLTKGEFLIPGFVDTHTVRLLDDYPSNPI